MKVTESEYIRINNHILSTFIDEDEDYNIFQINKKFYGKAANECFYIIKGTVFSTDSNYPMRLKIYRDDLY